MFGNLKIDPNRVAVYVRWSTDDQENGTTLEVQTESCQYFIKSQGWTFNPDLVFVDDGYSGGSIDRPALTRLRQLVEQREIEAVVVYKLDRLSRRVVDCVNLVREEWSGRCSLFSTAERFDTESPVGKMIFNILISFAEFERDVIRERTQSGKKKRAQQGRNAGHKYIFGYRRGADGGYEIDSYDPVARTFTGPAAIARRIFQEYLAGQGTVQIAARLTDEGIPSPLGAPVWRSSTVARILDNPTYAGTYRYGLSTYRMGEERKKLDEPSFVVDDAVPALITPEEASRVGQLREDRKDKHPRQLGSIYLLSGLTRCIKCGNPVNGKQGSDKRYYSCLGRLTLKTCDCALIGAPLLERKVLEAVRERVSGDRVRQHVEQVQEQIRADVAAKEYAVSSLEAELASLEKRAAKLEEDYFKGDLDGKTYTRLTERVEGERTRVEEQLKAARKALAEAKGATVDVAYLRSLAERLDVWETLPPESLKQVLNDVVAGIYVYQEKSHAKKGMRNPNELEIRIALRTDVVVTQSEATAG